MSLIQRIVTRRFDDIINQGYRLNVVGSQSGSGTDTVIQPGVGTSNAIRVIVVTGYILSTNNATDILFSLGFKNGSSATVPFASGYVRQGSPIVYTFPIGDERYSGNLQGYTTGDGLVLTTSAGPVAYTIYCRIIGEQVPLGYIEYPGAPAHNSPVFPPEGGRDRQGGDSV